MRCEIKMWFVVLCLCYAIAGLKREERRIPKYDALHYWSSGLFDRENGRMCLACCIIS